MIQGRVDRKEGGGGVERGQRGGRDRDGETERGRSSGKGRQFGGETGKGKTRRGRGQWEGGGGNRKGKTGKGAKGRGRRRGKRRGDFTDGYDEMPGWTYGMPGWNEVTELSDFVYPCNAGYPMGRDGEGEKKGQEEGRFHRWI